MFQANPHSGKQYIFSLQGWIPRKYKWLQMQASSPSQPTKVDNKTTAITMNIEMRSL